MISASKLQRICLLCITALILTGCNKGCSYSDEIDSESKVVSAGGKDFEVEASLVEHGNTRHRHKNYTVEIGIKYNNGRTRGNAEIMNADYEVDLNKKLDLASIRASDDQFTYQFIYDNYVCGTFHLLGDRLIDSPYGNGYMASTTTTNNAEIDPENVEIEDLIEAMSKEFGDYSSNPKAGEVDINDYPDRDQLLKDVITNKEIAYALSFGSDAAYVSQFLDQVDLTEDELIAFFERWPSDKTAKGYFTLDRVKALKSSNPEWYDYARFHMVEKYSLTFSDDHLHNFIFKQLNDPEICRRIDSAFVDRELGDKLDWTNDKYLFIRMEDSTPMSDDLAQKAESMCMSGINDFHAKWPKRPAADLDIAIRYFALSNNQQMVEKGTALLTTWPKNEEGDDASEHEVSNLIDVAEKCAEYLNKEDRKEIATLYLDHIDLVGEFDKEDVFDICNGVVDCARLMPVVDQYNKEKWGDNKFHYYKPSACKKRK